MPAMEPLCYLISVNPTKFSKEELRLLEAELFLKLYDELKKIFECQQKNFFRLMNFTIAKENEMLEKNFMKNILHDILSTKEYTLQGIARYTNIHEDVIHELVTGLNTKPLATYFRKVIELHRAVRREVYQTIAKKIAAQYLNINDQKDN